MVDLDIDELRRSEERLSSILDSVLAFIGVLSVDGVLLEANDPAVQASGVERDALIGQKFWDCAWWNFDAATQKRLQQAVKKAATGTVVRYDAEIRVLGDQAMWIDFQIVPVKNASGDVIELIPSGVDITERKASERHREMLLNELSHRVKNTLASIQSMAYQTARNTPSQPEFLAAFGARLRAISACHDLLVSADHEEVQLGALIRGQVAPYAAHADRVQLLGTDVSVPGSVAHSLGLILHELATNAAKYGALSTETGILKLDWEPVQVEGMSCLSMTWEEVGGPKVAAPTRRGFGTKLIEMSVISTDDQGVVFDFAPEGVKVRLLVRLK